MSGINYPHSFAAYPVPGVVVVYNIGRIGYLDMRRYEVLAPRVEQRRQEEQKSLSVKEAREAIRKLDAPSRVTYKQQRKEALAQPERFRAEVEAKKQAILEIAHKVRLILPRAPQKREEVQLKALFERFKKAVCKNGTPCNYRSCDYIHQPAVQEAIFSLLDYACQLRQRSQPGYWQAEVARKSRQGIESIQDIPLRLALEEAIQSSR